MELYGSRALTAKEQRIAELVADGMTNREAAAKVGLAEDYLKKKLCVIFDKLGVWNRLELALWFMKGKQ